MSRRSASVNSKMILVEGKSGALRCVQGQPGTGARLVDGVRHEVDREADTIIYAAPRRAATISIALTRHCWSKA